MQHEMHNSDAERLTLISNELSERIRRNPRYSLRSFAKNIGISHSLLSLILSGKRSVSKKVWGRIVDQLGLAPVPVIQSERSYNQVSLDTFALISDWYHYAILNLIEISPKKLNEKILANRLQITRSEAGMALLRLQRLGLIKKDKDKWKRCSASIKVENGVSTAATRSHHKQILGKALESLENDSFEIRDFSSVTIGIDPKLIPLARERIKQFRRQLMEELESKGNRSEVYHLAVQIYPVSKKWGKS